MKNMEMSMQSKLKKRNRWTGILLVLLVLCSFVGSFIKATLRG